MAHFHCDTFEGTKTENNQLLMWLQQNDLLDAKQQVMNHKKKITLDFLKQIDPIFLNGFIKHDLGLDGMLAFYFSSAVKKLQTTSQNKPPSQPMQIVRTVVLSNEEGKAINEIKNKYKEATQYLNELNKCINSLNDLNTQNQNTINEFKTNLINKINERMDTLIQISNSKIDQKKRQILSYSNRIKSYESGLIKAQQKHKELLNDNALDDMKRESEILQVNENINKNYNKVMHNKPIFNAVVSVDFDEIKMNNFIKSCGKVTAVKARYDNTYSQKLSQPPQPPIFSVKDALTTEHGTEAKMEFIEVKSNLDLECHVETMDTGGSLKALNLSPWAKHQPFAAQKHYTLRLRLGTEYHIRARYKNKYGWSEYSKEVRYTTRGHRVCFDGNGYVLMADNSHKQICELEIGDKVRSFPNGVANITCRIV
eukprot:435781_1